MKIKCIDNSKGDGSAKANERLVMGQIYTTEATPDYWVINRNMRLVEVPEGSFYANRFVIVLDDACEQCGEIH
jgi:hypothetical protein